MIRIANAPVSYGVFELSSPELVDLPDGETIAGWVQTAGYDGIDLGPVGLLGEGDALKALLHAHGLELAGGWIDLPFATSDDDEFAAARGGLDAILDHFVVVAENQTMKPLPTLADSGDDIRRARPGGAPELSLAADRWAKFTDRLNGVVEHVRQRGLEPTFHHHAVTYVETPAEIDALLAATDVGLTFDSGHLLIGGGDPLVDFDRWRDRINHIHLKDADRSVLQRALGAPDAMRSVWENRVFVPLGQGDLDTDSLVTAIVDSGYDGWVVVEQDVIPRSVEDIVRARVEQIANRDQLRKWFA